MFSYPSTLTTCHQTAQSGIHSARHLAQSLHPRRIRSASRLEPAAFAEPPSDGGSAHEMALDDAATDPVPGKLDKKPPGHGRDASHGQHLSEQASACNFELALWLSSKA